MTSDASSRSATPIAAAILALGVLAGGFLIGNGFARMRTADRTVSVKGVSEREAQADLAIWPLRLVATDDDLARCQCVLSSATSNRCVLS